MIKTKYREIKKEIPRLENGNTLNSLYKYEPYDMQARLPVIWDAAEGFIVKDIYGNKYIDFTSTIFVTNTGHRSIQNAIIAQSKKCIHSYTFPTKIRGKALEKLSQFLPSFCDKIYLASAGSEVTSWAVKLMRAINEKRQIIISLEGAFHGKTGDAGMLEHQEIKLKWPEEYQADVALENAISILEAPTFDMYGVNYNTKMIDSCCGLMIESYKGWEAKFLPQKYIQGLIEYCRKHGLFICFDEIQAGFWRTGKKFAYEWYEVEPDLICLGKALGGGFPVSALCGKAELFKNASGMSSTHSATPLACASIISVLESFEKMDMHEYFLTSELFGSMLNVFAMKYDNVITKVNHKGMVAAILFKDADMANIVARKMMDRGVLVVNTGKESVKLGPPLNIEKEALQEGLMVLEEVLKEVSKCLA